MIDDDLTSLVVALISRSCEAPGVLGDPARVSLNQSDQGEAFFRSIVLFNTLEKRRIAALIHRRFCKKG